MCKYTVKEHAENLINLLERKPSRRVRSNKPMCPSEHLDSNCYRCKMSRICAPCKICMEFIGLKYTNTALCPCSQVGSKEAVKRSWIALEEKGYLD